MTDADPMNLTAYSISDEDAADLRGAVLLPREIRAKILARVVERSGTAGLIDLFSQFIGLANSVVANNREACETILILEGKLDPADAAKANLPTLSGALAGIPLARGIDPAKTCRGCAFRAGSPANQSPDTTCTAEICSDGRDVDWGPFMCHEGLTGTGKPTRKCKGFAQAKKRGACR